MGTRKLRKDSKKKKRSGGALTFTPFFVVAFVPDPVIGQRGRLGGWFIVPALSW